MLRQGLTHGVLQWECNDMDLTEKQLDEVIQEVNRRCPESAKDLIIVLQARKIRNLESVVSQFYDMEAAVNGTEESKVTEKV